MSIDLRWTGGAASGTDVRLPTAPETAGRPGYLMCRANLGGELVGGGAEVVEYGAKGAAAAGKWVWDQFF